MASLVEQVVLMNMKSYDNAYEEVLAELMKCARSGKIWNGTLFDVNGESVAIAIAERLHREGLDASAIERGGSWKVRVTLTRILSEARTKWLAESSEKESLLVLERIASQSEE